MSSDSGPSNFDLKAASRIARSSVARRTSSTRAYTSISSCFNPPRVLPWLIELLNFHIRLASFAEAGIPSSAASIGTRLVKCRVDWLLSLDTRDSSAVAMNSQRMSTNFVRAAYSKYQSALCSRDRSRNGAAKNAVAISRRLARSDQDNQLRAGSETHACAPNPRTGPGSSRNVDSPVRPITRTAYCSPNDVGRTRRLSAIVS